MTWLDLAIIAAGFGLGCLTHRLSRRNPPDKRKDPWGSI
jgi:hypothetical protein